jgi:hypothetical protein
MPFIKRVAEIKHMRKRIAIIVGVLIILGIFLVIGYPSFFVLKPYASSIGLIGMPPYRICDCVGIGYAYSSGGPDANTDYYCIGILKNCKCYNEQKAREYGEAYEPCYYEPL